MSYRTHAEDHVDANAGDIVAIGWHNGSTSAEITFVVDKTTENLLSQAHFTTSIGSASVVRQEESPRSSELIWEKNKQDAQGQRIDPVLRCRDYASTSSPLRRECTAKTSGHAQLLKVELPKAFEGGAGKWTVYEVQLRAV